MESITQTYISKCSEVLFNTVFLSLLATADSTYHLAFFINVFVSLACAILEIHTNAKLVTTSTSNTVLNPHTFFDREEKHQELSHLILVCMKRTHWNHSHTNTTIYKPMQSMSSINDEKRMKKDQQVRVINITRMYQCVHIEQKSYPDSVLCSFLQLSRTNTLDS